MVPEMDPQGQVPLIFTPLDESWSDVSALLLFFFFLKMWGWKHGEGEKLGKNEHLPGLKQ